MGLATIHCKTVTRYVCPGFVNAAQLSLCYKGVVGEVVKIRNFLSTAMHEIALEPTYPI